MLSAYFFSLLIHSYILLIIISTSTNLFAFNTHLKLSISTQHHNRNAIWSDGWSLSRFLVAKIKVIGLRNGKIKNSCFRLIFSNFSCWYLLLFFSLQKTKTNKKTRTRYFWLVTLFMLSSFTLSCIFSRVSCLFTVSCA